VAVSRIFRLVRPARLSQDALTAEGPGQPASRGGGAGMALCATHGFRTVGICREQGQLYGRWVDVIVMVRLL
jgi:hypothetical protein